MSGITVTIYNDDEHGRDFQVVKVNTLSGRPETLVHKVQKPDQDADSHCEQYELLPGDIIMILPTGT